MIRRSKISQLKVGDVICLAIVQYLFEHPHKEMFYLDNNVLDVVSVIEYMFLNHSHEKKYCVNALPFAFDELKIKSAASGAVIGITCDFVLSVKETTHSNVIQTIFSGNILVSPNLIHGTNPEVIVLC